MAAVNFNSADARNHCCVENLVFWFQILFYAMEMQEQQKTWWKMRLDIVFRTMEAIHCLHSRPDSSLMNLNLSCDETTNWNDLDEDIKPYQCDIGSTTEPSVHNKIQIEDPRQELIKCSYETADRSNLDAHTNDHADADETHYQCAHCDFGSKYKDNLRDHIRVNHNTEALIKCSVLCYEAANERDINVHITNHINADETHYQCAHCDFTSKYKNNLRNHVLTEHTRQELIKCTMCSYETSDQSALNVHMKNHTEVDESYYQCAHCGHRTKKKWNLTYHIQLKHTRQGLIKCSLCNHEAHSKSALKVHMIKHSSVDIVTLYQCAHCNFRSKYKSSLTLHIKCIHTKEGLYECRFCFYKTVSKSRLVHHMSKHATPAEKIYHCPHCEYRSARNFNLMSHIRFKHMMQGLINCSLCDFQASCKYLLERHMKTHMIPDKMP